MTAFRISSFRYAINDKLYLRNPTVTATLLLTSSSTEYTKHGMLSIAFSLLYYMWHHPFVKPSWQQPQPTTEQALRFISRSSIYHLVRRTAGDYMDTLNFTKNQHINDNEIR